MEDVANNCSATTTVLWVWFWTTPKTWLTSTLVFQEFSSFLVVGVVKIRV
jgi:hypothetical protein